MIITALQLHTTYSIAIEPSIYLQNEYDELYHRNSSSTHTIVSIHTHPRTDGLHFVAVYLMKIACLRKQGRRTTGKGKRARAERYLSSLESGRARAEGEIKEIVWARRYVHKVDRNTLAYSYYYVLTHHPSSRRSRQSSTALLEISRPYTPTTIPT